MIRRIVAPAIAVIGLAAVVLGVCSATVWRPPDHLTVSHTVSQATQALVADPGVLDAPFPAKLANDQKTAQIKLTVPRGGSVVVAIGRDSDVSAWLGDTPAEHLVSFQGREKFAVKSAGSDEPVATAQASDLWVVSRVIDSKGSIDWSYRANGRWELVVAPAGSDGAETSLAGTKIEVTWPQIVTTPYLWPGVALGAFLIGLGLGIFVWSVRRDRRSKLVKERQEAHDAGQHREAGPAVARRAAEPVETQVFKAIQDNGDALEPGGKVSPAEAPSEPEPKRRRQWRGQQTPREQSPREQTPREPGATEVPGSTDGPGTPDAPVATGTEATPQPPPITEVAAALPATKQPAAPSYTKPPAVPPASEPPVEAPPAQPVTPRAPAVPVPGPMPAPMAMSPAPTAAPAEAAVTDDQGPTDRPAKRKWFGRKRQPVQASPVEEPAQVAEPVPVDLGRATPNRNWERFAQGGLPLPQGEATWPGQNGDAAQPTEAHDWTVGETPGPDPVLGPIGAAAKPPASPMDQQLAALRSSSSSAANQAAATIAAAMAAAGGTGSAQGLTRRQIREAERAAQEALQTSRASSNGHGWTALGPGQPAPKVPMQTPKEDS